MLGQVSSDIVLSDLPRRTLPEQSRSRREQPTPFAQQLLVPSELRIERTQPLIQRGDDTPSTARDSTRTTGDRNLRKIDYSLLRRSDQAVSLSRNPSHTCM
jgi:hypothetical protein